MSESKNKNIRVQHVTSENFGAKILINLNSEGGGVKIMPHLEFVHFKIKMAILFNKIATIHASSLCNLFFR